MKRTWTLIGVRDVPSSFRWYQSLFGQPTTPPSHDHFGQIQDMDGTVLLCLHRWGAHEHPSFDESGQGATWQRAPPGLSRRRFRHGPEDGTLPRHPPRRGAAREPEHANSEFSLRDPDGYYATISALAAWEKSAGQARAADEGPLICYSSLSATIGSTRVARTA